MKSQCILTFLMVMIAVSVEGAAQETVLRLQAPQEVQDLWNEWDGKYALYVHEEAGIQEFEDLAGRDILVAFIESDGIIPDAMRLISACGLSFGSVGIQNNADKYDEQFLEDTGRIGFMVPSVADHYGFEKNSELVRIEFE